MFATLLLTGSTPNQVLHVEGRLLGALDCIKGTRTSRKPQERNDWEQGIAAKYVQI